MVYVTPVTNLEYPASGPWPYCRMCNLVADTREELVSFAVDKMHLNPLKMSVSLKHKAIRFCITVRQREKAITIGAMPLDKMQTSDFLHRVFPLH